MYGSSFERSLPATGLCTQLLDGWLLGADQDGPQKDSCSEYHSVCPKIGYPKIATAHCPHWMEPTGTQQVSRQTQWYTLWYTNIAMENQRKSTPLIGKFTVNQLQVAIFTMLNYQRLYLSSVAALRYHQLRSQDVAMAQICGIALCTGLIGWVNLPRVLFFLRVHLQ